MSLLFMFSLPSQDLIKDRILPWLLTLQQNPFSQFYYMLSRKCLTQLQYFISTASSLWPTFLLQGWQIQQQSGGTQRKTSISLRKTYMKWRIHASITAPSRVGSNPNSLWAAVTFQRHQTQPLHFGAWCCLLWKHEMAQLTDFRNSVLGHRAVFFHILKITSSLEDWAGTCVVIHRHYIASVFHPPNSETANWDISAQVGFYRE